ncbi:hypothetical protein A3I27_03175 [Candidatus Giovannonibacteria bacterium RIFCSPLOWO2_02_FULL_43_11b]|uniref:Prepilin-type N-terminal cleavage/methylation domain-containing protein n=1 Tax=Candidatus Giovannonibacteria bacterium RIFCSPHIGHO2_12_FULL_43_15 TaxID=1798341 RepID=A0A1F5WP69_9BACT|nr:MAG: hypothetical protein A3B97_01635 [Candidatus Giovannonibacteria bacterium RIFCSPHIGHO2_02_FULL_43_32]OGF77435.1 MAG: hypothetical protein A3F23_01685 [Candidatus Giovannonibacteria bacterium RIFCSPHIGHO2_12_FULL_43_15]OGF89368.1 MAG: hypothetical protein A3I27_03175 [Candidatus Giovannonibacteria bacterium RIFCSPLOWO2_02_FULL_43_11b]OGF92145.1 MAG: hypothetical protein A3H04_00745 [Candidatus Giovannonibacteria bacterium RIFCSPLOWO2_12_FULL_43_11c]
MFTTENNKGFTLLEMLISMAIFTIAVFIVMTTLFSITNVQKKVIAKQSAEDNLRYAFESMTKEMRTGKKFHCGTSASDVSLTPQNCTFSACQSSSLNCGVSFTFQNSALQTVTYQVVNNQLVKSSDGNPPDCVSGPYINCQKLTSLDLVIVNKVNFYVSGSAAGDGLQSLATIVLEGQVLDPKNIGTAKLNLQTTISKRGLLDQP